MRDYVTRLIPADERRTLLPIRFARGALSAGLPRRDLFLSPEHCVSLQGVLIPARELVNGSTIDSFDDLEVIRYFHPELPRHSVIYAEGAAVETYLDTGNRNMFANALDSLLCAEPVSSEPCQPIVASGPILAEIRSRLAAEAAVLRSCLGNLVTPGCIEDAAAAPLSRWSPASLRRGCAAADLRFSEARHYCTTRGASAASSMNCAQFPADMRCAKKGR